jgi:hypothetical protein
MSDSIPAPCGACQVAATVPGNTRPDDAVICPTCGTTSSRETPVRAVAARPSRAGLRARARPRRRGVWGATIGVF